VVVLEVNRSGRYWERGRPRPHERSANGWREAPLEKIITDAHGLRAGAPALPVKAPSLKHEIVSNHALHLHRLAIEQRRRETRTHSCFFCR
jgi:hypothetical protein